MIPTATWHVSLPAARAPTGIATCKASPAVEIAIGRERHRPEQSFLEPVEIAGLLRWSRRHHPITARIQSMFFGWPWKASDAEILDLAHSLGGVAFWPVQTNEEAEQRSVEIPGDQIMLTFNMVTWR